MCRVNSPSTSGADEMVNGCHSDLRVQIVKRSFGQDVQFVHDVKSRMYSIYMILSPGCIVCT